jgi:fido (protein-threonine AMPylation protein)
MYLSSQEAEILRVLARLSAESTSPVSSGRLTEVSGKSPATVKRALEKLIAHGRVIRHGAARATHYTLAEPGAESTATTGAGPEWSDNSLSLKDKLAVPLAARQPVSYKRHFVDDYEPNKSWLLPERLATDLAREGRMQGRQPAGTYARKVLEQLLIDLSWSSSRLEGNRYSLLDTQRLFESGLADGDLDAVMLLNHKGAIEFLVDAVPEEGLSSSLIRNLHAVLMRDLLMDVHALGTIRTKVVNISDTVYLPAQVPSILQEMFAHIVEKAKSIRNPVEAAFFLWVNLAYLQPFEDGNKRTSRLAANIPLMLYNCAPLSFLDVDQSDYATAMMGVYEFRDVAVAADLFEWIYRRSMKKYAVVLEAIGAPDPLRLRYRQALNDAIALVVRERKMLDAVIGELGMSPQADADFRALLDEELAALEVFNCARYRLPMSTTEAWIADGRPR